MENRPLLYRILVLAIFGFMVSCATPIAPTGGPSDNKGPVLEFTDPETGTTNFEGRIFEFQFDEYINRSTVRGAITVEPDLGIEYDLSWKRKKMFIEFAESFPDSTTIIIKLGTEITDTRSNKIPSPITLAISTGDEIDSGEISGKVLLAENGRAADEQRILLYRQPVDLTKRANYQAQTDTSGSFNFSYLAEGRYKALLVDDRNRNKIWDQEIETAYPFYEEFINLEKEGSDTLDVIYTVREDTTKPVLQGVGLFSQNRMRFRFSESIQLTDSTSIQVFDSLGNTYSSAFPLYVSPREQFVLFAQNSEPLLEEVAYSTKVKDITDLGGSEPDSAMFSFTGTSQEDTTLQRIISANGQNGLSQTDEFVVTYAAPISESEIMDSVIVIEGDVDFDDWPEISIVQNKLKISPQQEWIEGVNYQFLVWNPVTQRRSMYEPEVWDSTEYGEIEINIKNADSSDTYYARVIDPNGKEVEFTGFSTATIIPELPPVSYTLILFRDENDNQRWDTGSVSPYQSPEKYYVQRNINVQEGFISEVNVTFE
ncbi:MAG: Ig-like domain-containing protein [Gracilimonas sp.]|uniref:Ig-like domain-containing protein n=1 Tax=Gracilimonas sp. TaxID=1974203 RepID=UPI0037523B5F|nr:Ig-like domain-containing protein [Gracilimonas sp.]